ncbi:MarR family transcriptional regulator [Roseiarcaceae bacterium H3SJ34-1]|uniref:MarR family winged helix-turn-helix transcriptional regulator n=1 Tax=Terripilifer ovatus TaxID=3032367 RepID=UPI003AB93806|nr:MarR family transcriptional regulator [Roseiarcaceae bacterium H3SJ34-1]
MAKSSKQLSVPETPSASLRVFKTRAAACGDLGEADIIIEESLGFVVSYTARILSRSITAALRDHGVAQAQWTVLLHLWSEEGISQNELCRRVGIEEATVSRTIDRLVRDDLVNRVRDPNNRRQYRLLLTPKGKQLQGELAPVVRNLNRKLADKISPAERQMLIRLLSQVRDGAAPSEGA